MKRQLRRVGDHSWIGGVCGGLAYWLGIPAWLIRLAVTVAILFYGISLLPYILLWIFMPAWKKDPEDYEEVAGS
jgi:phage shock protein PspC (stress-responsive transcriptional regulator)